MRWSVAVVRGALRVTERIEVEVGCFKEQSEPFLICYGDRLADRRGQIGTSKDYDVCR